MVSYNKNDPKDVNVEKMIGQEPELRRFYIEPRLEVMGNIRDLTLGGSPGTGDSGASFEDPLGGTFGLPELDLVQ